MKEFNTEMIPTFCAMCRPSAGCGIYALVKNGRFVGVEGMKESPLNKGKLCPKAYGSVEWVYSPQRLTTPLRRVGQKGEGRFEKITWDEALSCIANKLLEQKVQFGPESLGMLSPAFRSYSPLLYRFLMAHGSPNYGHSGICATQREFVFSHTLGFGKPVPDYEHADVILIWGKQPVFSGSCKGGIRSLLAAKARGATIISIKPSIEPDVAKSDIWVPVRPGTDAALVLGMLHVIITEKLYDAGFVNDWCFGFEEFKTYVQSYTPEWAETISGVPARQVREVARIYATAERAAIDPGNGLEHAPSASDAIRSIAILMAITGNLDRKGGNLARLTQPMPPLNSIRLSERQSPELRDKLVGPEFPSPFQPFVEGLSSAYFRVIESVLREKPYPIKTLIAPGTQPTVSTRGTKTVIEALKKVDFFVVIDVMETAELAYADIVVPVATSYETEIPFDCTDNWIMARRKIIEPLGDYKSMHEFWFDLAVKMNYGDDFWNGSVEACMDYQLEPLGITFQELKRYPHGICYPPEPPHYEKYDEIFAAGSLSFSRSSMLHQNKVAIRNIRFEEEGFAAFPGWREPPESPTATPELLDRYPLILSDYHTSKVYNASWLRNIPILREVLPCPILHINPRTAERRGISDGDPVIVESLHGWIELKAELYPGIRPDTVMALHGWWQGCSQLGFEGYKLDDGGANTNNMYSTDRKKAYDPLIIAMTSQTLVEVRKKIGVNGRV